MNPDVLFWGCLVLAFLAGVGVIPTIGLFRYREPVFLPRKPEPAEPPLSEEGPKREPRHAAPVTSHHGYDTMDVLAAGWQAAQEHQEQLGAGFTMRACGAMPAGTNEAAGWRCVKPAGHPYLHETATGGAWGDNTFGQDPSMLGGEDGTWTPDPARHPYPAEPYAAGPLPAGGSV